MLGIPVHVEHVARDERALFRGAVAAAHATPHARAALTHLDEFVSFVHHRVPEALERVRSGLSLVIDERLVDDAVGEPGLARLGRAGTRFAGEPIESATVVGHELTHALGLGDGNYLSDELNADLVGLAYARSIGALDAGAGAWRIDMVGRDLRHPTFPTLDALKGAATLDVHLMAGPVGAALARAADTVGVPAIDAIAVEAAQRDMPRTSELVRARIADLVWSNRSPRAIEHEIVDLAMTDHASALFTAADRMHGRGSPVHDVLARELAASGVAIHV